MIMILCSVIVDQCVRPIAFDGDTCACNRSASILTSCLMTDFTLVCSVAEHGTFTGRW